VVTVESHGGGGAIDGLLTGLRSLLVGRGARAAEAQDVIAAVREQLVTGELAPEPARVRVAAVRMLLARRGAGPDEAWLVRFIAPELEPPQLAESERADIRAAIGDAVARIPARERAVLRMHLEHGLGIEPAAKLLGMDRAAATRLLAQREREVVTHVRSMLAKRWGENDTLARVATTIERIVTTLGEP
jgi:RNA polymerase sigma-70 factor (ECF subfamily)